MGRWDKKDDKIEETQGQQGQQEVKPEAQEASPSPVYLGSELDAYIYEKVKGQPKTIEDVEIKLKDAGQKNYSVLALPKELEPYGKKYSFRWINKKKRAIDHATDVIGWTLVSKLYFEKLPKHLFTANGVIERGDAILAFIPQAVAQKIRLRPAELSRERVQATPMQNLRKWKDRGEKYYKPDLSAAESDNETVAGNQVVMD